MKQGSARREKFEAKPQGDSGPQAEEFFQDSDTSSSVRFPHSNVVLYVLTQKYREDSFAYHVLLYQTPRRVVSGGSIDDFRVVVLYVVLKTADP